MPDHKFGNFEVSLVGINEELIVKVAAKADVTVDRVRQYLADKKDQDNILLKLFLFYGVVPVNKAFVRAP
jgi:hypothetical protein